VPLLALIPLLLAPNTYGATLYKSYVVRYDRGWDILCDPYEVQQGDWVLKIFREKGEIAHENFKEFLGIFQRLNPQVKDIDLIRAGQEVDIPLKKLSPGTLPGQSTGVVTIPFVLISSPPEMIKKNTRSYTVHRGDTLSQLIAKRFGGQYGSTTYREGLQLFKAANPQIKNINRIYAGQKIYMPDPSIRKKIWYSALFDKSGHLVKEKPNQAEAKAEATQGMPAEEAAPPPPVPPTESKSGVPAAQAAAVIGAQLLNKGTYYLPMKKGSDFELDLSRYPMIDFQNGSKVILTTQDKVMNVDLPLIQSYWKQVKVVKVAKDASSQEILEAVLSAFSDQAEATNRLAFDDKGVSVSVSAKWIHSAPSADDRVIRHTCITPIGSAAQRTDEAIVRYLDQNNIVIKDIFNGAPQPEPVPLARRPAAQDAHIDGSSQKALIDSFARLMGFHYSPNTSISFPYAGIQVQALSNLLSCGNGTELLVDFGNLYGDAIKAIRNSGMKILQIGVKDGSLDILRRLMNAAGLPYTVSPVFYGADRPAEFNTAISVKGILIAAGRGEKRLFTDAEVPELIDVFMSNRGIRLVHIDKGPGMK
jgi:hypothetical protein